MAGTSYQILEVLSYLLLGEGLTSVSMNNRTHFFGENK